jgi:hypothetical protein
MLANQREQATELGGMKDHLASEVRGGMRVFASCLAWAEHRCNTPLLESPGVPRLEAEHALACQPILGCIVVVCWCCGWEGASVRATGPRVEHTAAGYRTRAPHQGTAAPAHRNTPTRSSLPHPVYHSCNSCRTRPGSYRSLLSWRC